MPGEIFEKEFQVRSSELDLGRKLRVTALLDYLQDAAGDHARRLGVAVADLAARHLTWVISRYHLRLMGPAGKGTPVKVRTWPSSREGLFSCREFEVLVGESLIALATSSWAAVDVKTRRPVRLEDHLPTYALHHERAIPDDFRSLPRLSEPEQELPFRVRRTDLDLNRHVNNVVYVEWALESLPEEVADRFRLAELEVAYRAEALYGDTVIARSARQENGERPVFLHQLVNGANGKELTRLVTRWERKDL